MYLATPWLRVLGLESGLGERGTGHCGDPAQEIRGAPQITLSGVKQVPVALQARGVLGSLEVLRHLSARKGLAGHVALAHRQLPADNYMG